MHCSLHSVFAVASARRGPDRRYHAQQAWTWCAALLASVIVLVGCAGRGQLGFERPLVADHLDGDYQRLASCTHGQPARQQGQLSMTNLRDQRTVTIAFANGPETHWELSSVNEGGGRQTRLEVVSANGSFPSEHALALARACAAN
jgi:hypothetical protein